jgi:hypothetical protein
VCDQGTYNPYIGVGPKSSIAGTVAHGSGAQGGGGPQLWDRSIRQSRRSLAAVTWRAAGGWSHSLPGVLIGIPCGLRRHTAYHRDSEHSPGISQPHSIPGACRNTSIIYVRHLSWPICICDSQEEFVILIYFTGLCHLLR